MLNDFLKDILCFKKGNLLDFPENEMAFNPFLIQRTLSMFSLSFCNILNETTNKRLYKLDKKEFYKILLLVMPKQRKTFSKFFKKEKNNKYFTEKQKKAIEILASNNKLSYKQVEKYVELFDLNINFLK